MSEIRLSPADLTMAQHLINSRGLGGTEYFARYVLNLRVPDGSGDALTWQQKEAADTFDRLFLAQYKKKVLQLPITPQESIDAMKLGVSDQAAKSTGKTCLENIIALKTICCFKKAIILMIGASEDQVKETSWAQMSSLISESPVRDDIVLKAESLHMAFNDKKEEATIKKSRFVGIRASGSDVKNLAGQHPEALVYILTEASGISREVARELETTFGYKYGVSIMWVGYNPDRPVSYAAETQTINRASFECFQHSAEDSPLADKDFLASREKKHGRESFEYQVYSLGALPESASDSLVSWRQLQEAINNKNIANENSPLVFSIDPARGGGCECVLGVRQEWIFYDKIWTWQLDDTVVLADMICDKIVEVLESGKYKKDIDYYIAHEMDGLGGSLYDNMKHHPSGVCGRDGSKVVKVKMNRSAQKIKGAKNHDGKFTKYKTIRDKVWARVREVFQDGVIKIPDDPKLIEQLSGLTFSTESGFWRAFNKKELKVSPDRADMIAISALVEPKPRKERVYLQDKRNYVDRTSKRVNNNCRWLTA